MRLIDAEALKEAIENHFDMLDAYFPNKFIEEIDNAPTVEDSYNKGYSDAVQGIADEMVRRNQHIEDNRQKGEWVKEPNGRTTDIYRLISRQDAIDILEEQLDYLQTLNKNENPTAEAKWYGVNWARNTIADLPSAQEKGGADMREETSVCQNPKGNCFTCKLFEVCDAKTKPADMRGEDK